MNKVIQFPVPPEDHYWTWEGVVESGIRIYAPGMPPPPGICPEDWAAALSRAEGELESAEVIALESFRVEPEQAG